MLISIIAAIGQNNELGAQNKLMWHIPGELPRFKRITTGHSIIMGRKTFESIGRVLPNRTNIIITRDPQFTVEGAIVVHSFNEAIKSSQQLVESREQENQAKLTTDYSLLTTNNEVFIIGGGQIFKEAMPMVQKLYLTIVHASFPQADVFFPDYSEFTKVIEREEHESEEFTYTFLTLEK